ncbi:glycosyltransferase [Paeniglutamicibacter gangotriensis]|uniref:Glycosyltransferase 28 domain-containing protein n=1 Tax=Paeniglutamicibacter gangotriensis Lz1y TaxID=1276920 RepID=M7MSK5_9MICC|nr:glycosyltransferase [Paeniglutamicibacter gangotriensis]EMQ99382.1 glycosyltransferase 28 domain-containing protein [Paeniglutamicibacter gangotriensis Lz1y]
MTTDSGKYRLVVSVGTDHHLFDRLIDWVDQWVEQQSEAPSVFVQHGASRIPRNGVGKDRLARADLLKIYQQADVVVVQGGPGSILDVREVGIIPIAVPRFPQLREVVDGHQIEFTKVMAEHGNAIYVDEREALHQALDKAMLDPAGLRTEPRLAAPEAAGVKLAQELEKTMNGSTRNLNRILRRIKQAISF